MEGTITCGNLIRGLNDLDLRRHLHLRELIDIEDKDRGSANLNLDLIMQSIGSICDARRHRHEHLAAVTGLAQGVGHSLDLRLVHTHQQRRVALAHESA